MCELINMEELINSIWQKKGIANRQYRFPSNKLAFTCSMRIYHEMRQLAIRGDFTNSIDIDLTNGQIRHVLGIPVYPCPNMEDDEWIVSAKI